MKREEFIKRCCKILDSLHITEYKFIFTSISCDFVFQYEHFMFHRVIDCIISYFPYTFSKLHYAVVCHDNEIVIRYFDK